MYYSYENEPSSNHFCSYMFIHSLKGCDGLGLDYFVAALNFRILLLHSNRQRRFKVIFRPTFTNNPLNTHFFSISS